MRIVKGIGTICLFFLMVASAVQADVITLRADTWCPYNCDPGTDTPGFMVEIADIVFKKHGHTVDYKVMPWARAIQDARVGKVNGIIGAGKEDAPEFVFPEIEVARMKTSLFVKGGVSWKFEGVDSLKNKVLGVIKDYTYTEEIDAYIKENGKNSKRVQMASGENALDSNIKKLISGRIDVIIEDANVVSHYLKTNALEKAIQVAADLPPDDLFIAFSPANPNSKHYAKMISEGVIELRKSGELQTVLEKYGLKDWK